MRAIFVAERYVDETHEDGTGNGANVRRPDLFFRQVECNLDLRHQRRDGEPDEKRREKSEPRAVECAHVGTGEAAQLDLRRLVILVTIDFDIVCLVLFDFGLEYEYGCKREAIDLQG